MKTFRTYKYRLKNKNLKYLNKLALDVNAVWNYINDISFKHFKRHRKFMSEFDLNSLTSGSSKEMNLNSASIQEVSKIYCKSKKQHKKVKLRWRSKKSLGFVPVRNLKMLNDGFKFNGKVFKIWKHREFEGTIKTSTLSQDSKGYWYLNLVCEQEIPQIENKEPIGIDLGLKTLATLSDGTKFNFKNITKKYADKLAMAQRAKKKRQVTNIHRKIKNIRKDECHKISRKIVDKSNKVYVGDVNSTKLIKTRMKKSIYDRSWFQFKVMIHYKSVRDGGFMKEINESFSSVTCSCCSARSGPSGLGNLGIRTWKCSSCGEKHDRDINAAKNILRFGLGHETL